MADSPVDIITEVMSDLGMGMEYGSDLDYQRTEDGRIAIRMYEDGPDPSEIKGYLKFEEAR